MVEVGTYDDLVAKARGCPLCGQPRIFALDAGVGRVSGQAGGRAQGEGSKGGLPAPMLTQRRGRLQRRRGRQRGRGRGWGWC